MSIFDVFVSVINCFISHPIYILTILVPFLFGLFLLGFFLFGKVIDFIFIWSSLVDSKFYDDKDGKTDD